jgi:hypothetical protein
MLLVQNLPQLRSMHGRITVPGRSPEEVVMDHGATDFTASLEAYPNIRAAAELIGVSPSTLSRREDLGAEHRGERDRVLRPAEVLRLAAIYRKRSLNDVAQELIDHARKASPDEAPRVEKEVEAFFEGRLMPDNSHSEFLALARRLLPAWLYRKVEETVTERDTDLTDALVGYPPAPKS